MTVDLAPEYEVERCRKQERGKEGEMGEGGMRTSGMKQNSSLGLPSTEIFAKSTQAVPNEINALWRSN